VRLWSPSATLVAHGISVVAYHPSWSKQGRRAVDRLRSALDQRGGDSAFAIHHVGSTAVPGMAAQPILDLLVEIKAPRRVHSARIPMRPQSDAPAIRCARIPMRPHSDAPAFRCARIPMRPHSDARVFAH
jgi:hypothetical protein